MDIDGASSSDGELVAGVMATGTPPVFVSEPKEPTTGNAYAKITFTAIVKDVDGDTLNLTWEWGDGTPNGTTATGPAGSNTIVTNSHYYNLTLEQGRGGYKVYLTMNLTLDDGNGNLVTAVTSVEITMPANSSPQIIDLSGPTVIVEPGEEVVITANASDPEGESLTWTFAFNNSVETYDYVVNHTAATAPGEVVECIILYTFSAPGSYSVTLNLSDALPPYQVWPHNLSANLAVTVVANSIPNVLTTINVDPDSPLVQSGVGYVVVNYSIQASDPDGDVLTVTWDFDDGTALVVNTSAGGTIQYEFIEHRNYTEAGEFNVSVVVTDGRAGHEVTVYRNILVSSNNRPPDIASFAYLLSGGVTARANETINFTLVIQDAEFDAIEVVIDFGDNSTRLYLNLSSYSEGNLTASFTHVYSEQGNYTITILYTDNKIGLFEHHKNYTSAFQVSEPITGEVRIWDWWDYFTLSLVFVIPIIVVVEYLLVARRRKVVEAQGLSLEEYKLITSEAKKSKKAGEANKSKIKKK